MERVKVETKYIAILEQRDNYTPAYECRLLDMERVKEAKEKGHILGCVVYEGGFYSKTCCSLYYNESGYSKEELRAAGYDIVDELREVEVYEESEKIF